MQGAAQGGTCVLVGNDQDWINQAGELAEAALGCQLFTKVLYHVPSGGSHDQETFNHASFEVKCAGTQLLSSGDPQTCNERCTVLQRDTLPRKGICLGHHIVPARIMEGHASALMTAWPCLCLSRHAAVPAGH